MIYLTAFFVILALLSYGYGAYLRNEYQHIGVCNIDSDTQYNNSVAENYARYMNIAKREASDIMSFTFAGCSFITTLMQFV